MPTPHLLENGNCPDTRRCLEQGHDFFFEYAGQGIRAPSLPLRLPLGWKSGISLDAVCGRCADAGFGGRNRHGMSLSELHIEPHLMIVDVAARHLWHPFSRSYAPAYLTGRYHQKRPPEGRYRGLLIRLRGRVAAADYSTAALSEPDMRTTHPALWIDIQNPSESWADAGGWLSSFQAVLSEVIRPANHAGG
jgi:hypothetical protein